MRRLDGLIGDLTKLLRGLERTSYWDRGGHRLPRGRTVTVTTARTGSIPTETGSAGSTISTATGCPTSLRRYGRPDASDGADGPGMRYEIDPQRCPFPGKYVKYLTEAEREEHRLFVP